MLNVNIYIVSRSWFPGYLLCVSFSMCALNYILSHIITRKEREIQLNKFNCILNVTKLLGNRDRIINRVCTIIQRNLHAKNTTIEHSLISLSPTKMKQSAYLHVN